MENHNNNFDSDMTTQVPNSLSDKRQRRKTVAVVGLGYVGLPLAILSAQKGYNVLGIDTDKKKVDLIKKKVSPFVDKRISETLRQVKLPVSVNPVFVREAGIIIICVPTPVTHDYKPDFEPLEEAAREVSKYIRPDSLVIIESTVNPGVCETIVLPILEEGSGLKAGDDFQLSHCPERVNPGDDKWNLESISRVVGSLTQAGLRRTLAFYRSIVVRGKVTPMQSIKEAEAVKVVENSFRDINIAFVNELAMSFSLMGIDVVNVIKGASTKPFGFMAHYPGCGVGGHCIPVDPYYLIEYGKENGFDHEFLKTARHINNYMPTYTIKQLEIALSQKGFPKGRGKIAVLGATYKPDVDDIRESPSLVIWEELKKRGYKAEIYDPLAKQSFIKTNIEETLDGSLAVIVATAHTPFLSMSPEYFVNRGIKIVIDGRNCLNKSLFEFSDVAYRGIGR